MQNRTLNAAILAVLALALLGRPEGLQCASLPLPDHARYVFEKVGANLGLSTTTAVALFQDSRGFIWIGTDHGILRYDGTRVTKFGSEQGVPDSAVSQIAEDSQHHIWIATAIAWPCAPKQTSNQFDCRERSTPLPGFSLLLCCATVKLSWQATAGFGH